MISHLPAVFLARLQVIVKDSVTLKSGILLRISDMFRIAQNGNHGMITTSSTGPNTLGLLTNIQHQRLDKDSHGNHNSGGVFVVGVGNRKHDGDAYRIAGVPASCVLIIDTKAVIKIWSDSYPTTTSASSSSGSPLSPSITENKSKDSNTNTGDLVIVNPIHAHPSGGPFDTYNDVRLVPYLKDAYQRHSHDHQSR